MNSTSIRFDQDHFDYDCRIDKVGTDVVITVPFSMDDTAESFAKRHGWVEPKKGYCQRTKELILEANPHYKTFEESPYRIIDYPLENTVAVLFPHSEGIIGSTERLRKHKAELRLIKPVKNGVILCYHFND